MVTLVPDGSLAARLRDCCAADWEAFIGHDFVRQLGDGSLPEACFRYYRPLVSIVGVAFLSSRRRIFRLKC